MLRVCFLLNLILVGFPATGQIVNIENARLHTDTTGWAGNTNASMAIIKSVQNVFSLDMNAHVQFKSRKDLYLLLGSYGILNGGGAKLVDNSFLHFRYNRKLNDHLRWEAFTQIQKNVINNIEYRFLVGTGPRFKVVDRKKFKLFFAGLIMLEQEKEKVQPANISLNWRNSNYVSFSIYPNSQLDLVSTTFYQPLISLFNDFRILNQSRLRVKATKKLSLSINYNYLFDHFPPLGTPETNYTFSTGLDYDF